MAQRKKRCATEMSLARTTGRRWGVAMCETEWKKFSCSICVDARYRLLALLLHFCDHGEIGLGGHNFGWLAPASDAPGARQAKFEACGVVILGHSAPAGPNNMFFVTSIEEDPPAPLAERRRGSGADVRQGHLPLTSTKTERN